MVRTFSGNEIAAEAGIGQERLAWLVSVGIVRPQEPDVFCFGDVFRAKLLSAVLDAGIPESVLERAHPYTWTKPAEQVSPRPDAPHPCRVQSKAVSPAVRSHPRAAWRLAGRQVTVRAARKALRKVIRHDPRSAI